MGMPIQSIGSTRKVEIIPGKNLVKPSLFSWVNLGYEDLVYGPQISIDPSPAACDLACGEGRSDCAREGGSRWECHQEHRQCLWDCATGMAF